MKQTKAPKAKTPSPTDSFQHHGGTDQTGGLKSVFVGMTLDMSWRLAVVVLAPIVIGNKVDIALKTTPWFTVLGLLLALAGSVLVIRSTVKRADAAMAAQAARSKHD